jgi:hypothetical protein
LKNADTNELRSILMEFATKRQTTDYKTVTELLNFRPPNTIAQTTNLLEACQEDDVLLERPQLAAVVVQKTGNRNPRPGFYQKLSELGVYNGPDRGAQAQMWHQNELEKVYSYYSAKDTL